MPGVACPPVGPVGLGSPPAAVRCAAQTATLPISGRFARRARPDTSPASVRAWCPWWAHDPVEAPTTPGPLVARSPHPGVWSRREMALPRSRVTPLKTCPALRPRWCPAHSPVSHTGLLPSGACTPSACAALPLRLSFCPRLDTFRGSITRPASSLTPASYSHGWAGTWRSLLTCWRGVRQVGLEP